MFPLKRFLNFIRSFVTLREASTYNLSFFSNIKIVCLFYKYKKFNTIAISFSYTITNMLRLLIYTSMNTFIDLNLLALALQNILDTLSDILNMCLCFSLIKIEPVSIFQAKPRLVPSFQSVVYTFLLKMLSLVLIKN